jgi:hypothetical protein
MEAYNRVTAEGARALREGAAATMAGLGGEASVPSTAQVNVPGLITPGTQGAAGGVVGVSLGGAQMFDRALRAGQASQLAQIQAQQLQLASDIEAKANQAVAERVQAERDRVQQYKINALLSAQSIAGQIAQDRAKLMAAAAGADTRSGKQKADAELAAYERKAAIDWKYTLKELNARATAQGLSKEETAMLQMQANQAYGQTTMLGSVLNNALNRIEFIPTNRATGEILGPGGKPYKFAGDPGTWYISSGMLAYDPDGAKGKQQASTIDMPTIIAQIQAQAGYIMNQPKEKRKAAWNAYWKNMQTGLGSPTIRKALVIAIGKDAENSDWWYNTLTNPNATTGTSLLPQASAQTQQRKIERVQQQAAAQRKPGPVLPTLPQVASAATNPSGQIGLGFNTILGNIPVIGSLLGVRK